MRHHDHHIPAASSLPKNRKPELFIQTLEHYRAEGKFLLHGDAVMPDHVHILLTPAIDVSTAKAIQYIKGGYSHARSMKAIWHSGHYEHRIRDAADYEAQRRYLRNNPAPGNPPRRRHPRPTCQAPKPTPNPLTPTNQTR